MGRKGGKGKGAKEDISLTQSPLLPMTTQISVQIHSFPQLGNDI